MTAGDTLQRYFHDTRDCIVLRRDGRKTLLKCNDSEAGVPLFLKIYHHAGRSSFFPVIAALSTGARHYRIGQRLALEGISVPTPVGFAVKRNRWGCIEQSLFASRWVDDMLPLREYTVMRDGKPSLNEHVLRTLNRSLGAFLAALHQRGVRAYDVNAGNFLVQAVGRGDFRIVLVDLEDVTFRRSISRNQRIRNLAQLTAGMLPLNRAAAEICKGYFTAFTASDEDAFIQAVDDRAHKVLALWNDRLDTSFAQIAAAQNRSKDLQEP